MTVELQVPEVFEPLLAPNRHKGAYGGRGGAKSHFFAGLLIFRCRSRKTRAVCIREVQNTIRDSVRQLLVDKIVSMGLEGFFEILETEIRGRNGSLIVFRGMQAYNAANIKSLEDFDIAWVEEAQTLSAQSLKLLRPTIRKEGSELWYGWNPRHDTDPVDKFFRDGNKRSNMVCVSVNWRDNPWFPSVLKQEMLDDYAADPEMAEHVWGGGYELITEASYYGRLIAHAEKEGRIGDYPYNPQGEPLITSWDLGVDDYTAIVFWQVNGLIPTVVDFYEAGNIGVEITDYAMPEIMAEADIPKAAAQMIDLGRDVPFKYKLHMLPHDVKVREWGSGGKQRTLTLMERGVKPLKVGVAANPADRINAMRALLPHIRFNDTPRIRALLSHLRRYSRKFSETVGQYTGELHDEHSHAADAAGEFAINFGLKQLPKPVDPPKKALSGQVMLPGAPAPRNSARISL
jgi:phage terminase large subunit